MPSASDRNAKTDSSAIAPERPLVPVNSPTSPITPHVLTGIAIFCSCATRATNMEEQLSSLVRQTWGEQRLEAFLRDLRI